jgi:hypothetical protein
MLVGTANMFVSDLDYKLQVTSTSTIFGMFRLELISGGLYYKTSILVN